MVRGAPTKTHAARPSGSPNPAYTGNSFHVPAVLCSSQKYTGASKYAGVGRRGQLFFLGTVSSSLSSRIPHIQVPLPAGACGATPIICNQDKFRDDGGGFPHVDCSFCALCPADERRGDCSQSCRTVLSRSIVQPCTRDRMVAWLLGVITDRFSCARAWLSSVDCRIYATTPTS